MNYETLKTEKMYRGRAFDVRRDEISLPNGLTTSLDIVEHVSAVTILPVDMDGSIWFVHQYRHPAGLMMIELPAGTLEEDEDPKDCALREIQEEIGMGAGQLQQIGGYFLAPGYSTEYMYVYMAKDLYPSPLPQDIDEFLSVVRYPIDQTLEMVRAGQIQDAKTLATLLLAGPHLDARLG